MNVDPRHWADYNALCADLRAHRVYSVRTVLKATDEPTAWPDALHRHGLSLLSVLALESLSGFGSVEEALEYYSTIPWDILQLCNESDVDCSDDDDCSSWYQTQEEVDDMITYARHLMPDRVLIGPGLASGNEHWLDTLLNANMLDGIAAHPYAETLDTIDDFIHRYEQYGKLYITEYPDVNMTRRLQSLPSYAFCWSKVMHPDFGIREDPEKLAIYVEGAKPMPDFYLGFADYAAQHPEVGEPLTNQFTDKSYTDDIEHRTFDITRQETTRGTLWYYPESNAVRFDPKE